MTTYKITEIGTPVVTDAVISMMATMLLEAEHERRLSTGRDVGVEDCPGCDVVDVCGDCAGDEAAICNVDVTASTFENSIQDCNHLRNSR